MKICAKCQNEFPIYHKIGTKYHNLCHRKFCLTCSPFKAHNTRDITKEREVKKKKTSYESVKLFRHRKKEKAVTYLGGKCRICGYSKSIFAMDFHHLDPEQKDFSICSKSSWGFERLKEELDKCALLCANCHREVHAGVAFINGSPTQTRTETLR